MSDHKYSFAIIFTVWGNFYFWARISKEYFRRIQWTITWTFMVSRLERNANSSVKIRYFVKIVETICQKFIFRGLISWLSAGTEVSPLQFCRGRLFNEKTHRPIEYRVFTVISESNIFNFETLSRALISCQVPAISVILGYCLSKLG